jgi:hypothetical protein
MPAVRPSTTLALNKTDFKREKEQRALLLRGLSVKGLGSLFAA